MRTLIALYLIFLCFPLSQALSCRDFKSRVKTFLGLSVQWSGIFLPYAMGYAILEYGLLGFWWDLVIGIGLAATTVVLITALERKSRRSKRVTC